MFVQLLQPAPSYLTIIFLNESEISLAVSGSYFSGLIETPTASLSSIIFSNIGGRLSSVARMVNLTICFKIPLASPGSDKC